MEVRGCIISPLNYLEEVRYTARILPDVQICDCTLREGEQAADTNFTVEDKIAIAKKLDEVGVHEIEVGFGNADQAAIRGIRASGVKAKLSALVLGWSPTWRRDAEQAVEAGVDIVNLVFGSSDIRLERVFKWTRRELLERSVEAVKVVRQLGRGVKYTPSDTTRADLNLLKELYAAVTEAGADSVVVADSFGVVGPPAMRYLVRQVRQATPIPIEIHTHQDVGLALANMLAGLEEGAQVAHVSVLGLADRAGNTSLDELVVTLLLFYGVDTGIHTEKLTELARVVATRASFPIPISKALVGQNAFAQKLDAHVAGFLAAPAAYEAINPDITGAQRRIALGNYSGPVAVRAKLRQRALELSDERVDSIVQQVRQFALREKRSLTDEEFWGIADGVIVARS